jgi:hypothetical protein
MTDPPENPQGEPRKFGALKGKVWLAPDWDSEVTNERIARDFYAEDDEVDPLFKPPEPHAYTRTTEP